MFGALLALGNSSNISMITGAHASAFGAGKAAVESEPKKASRFSKSIGIRLSLGEPYLRAGGASRHSPPTDRHSQLARRRSSCVRHANVHWSHPEKVRERVNNNLCSSKEILKHLFKRTDELASTYAKYPQDVRNLLCILMKWREQLVDHQQLLTHGGAHKPKYPSIKNTLVSNRLRQEWAINRKARLLQRCCKKFIDVNFQRHRQGNDRLVSDDKKIRMISRQVELIDLLKKAITELSGQKVRKTSAPKATGTNPRLPPRSAGRAKPGRKGAERDSMRRVRLEVRKDGRKHQADLSGQSPTATGSFSHRSLCAFIESIRKQVTYSTATTEAGASVSGLGNTRCSTF